MNNPTASPRFYNGNPVAYQKQINRRHIGGRGYLYFTEYRVWNPANPERTLLLSEADFFMLTSAAVAIAA